MNLKYLKLKKDNDNNDCYFQILFIGNNQTTICQLKIPLPNWWLHSSATTYWATSFAAIKVYSYSYDCTIAKLVAIFNCSTNLVYKTLDLRTFWELVENWPLMIFLHCSGQNQQTHTRRTFIENLFVRQLFGMRLLKQWILKQHMRILETYFRTHMWIILRFYTEKKRTLIQVRLDLAKG